MSEDNISITYKPLKHTLIDKSTTLTAMCRDLNLSTSLRAKLNQDEFVSLKTVAKICRYLDVPIEDVVEVIRD